MKAFVAWALLLLIIASAQSQGAELPCPTDHPNKRYVQEYLSTMNTIACIPQLVCWKGEDVCDYSAAECQWPRAVVRTLCLSDDELKAAEQGAR